MAGNVAVIVVKECGRIARAWQGKWQECCRKHGKKKRGRTIARAWQKPDRERGKECGREHGKSIAGSMAENMARS